MIDTDKYEGHDTDKRMKLLFRDNLLHIELSDADYHLLVDAPLLLEEVKRLRDFIQSVWDGLGEAGRSDTYQLFNTLPRSVVKLTKYNGEDE